MSYHGKHRSGCKCDRCTSCIVPVPVYVPIPGAPNTDVPARAISIFDPVGFLPVPNQVDTFYAAFEAVGDSQNLNVITVGGVTNQIRATQAGFYLISYSIPVLNTTPGNQRVFYVAKNITVRLPASEFIVPLSLTGFITATVTFVANLMTGDTLSLQVNTAIPIPISNVGSGCLSVTFIGSQLQ